MWSAVSGTSIHFRPFAHSRVRVCERSRAWINTYPRPKGMVVGLAPRVGKVVHPCRVLIYCNSLAPGSRSTLMKFASNVRVSGWSSRKIELLIMISLYLLQLLDVWLRDFIMLCLLLIHLINYARILLSNDKTWQASCIHQIYSIVDKSCKYAMYLRCCP
jgi:hypothetical protein